MCACLPTHYSSQLDSFYPSFWAQSLLFLLPSPELTPLGTTSPGLTVPHISVLWSHFCVAFSLWADSSLHWSPFFKSSFNSALMKIHELSPDSAAFSHFYSALTALCSRKERHFDGHLCCSFTGCRRGSINQRPTPVSPSVNVSSAK